VDNAKFIIPTAIVFWLVTPLFISLNLPGWVNGLGVIASILFIAGLVAFLMARQTAWHALAEQYPVKLPVNGPWKTCRTAVIARVGVDDPTYEQQKVRLVFVLRLALGPNALNLAVIPVFRALAPPVQIPWSAIARARILDASGWVRAPSDPGAAFQLTYDPGYKGQFVELQVREPQVFIQLPLELLGEAAAYLPIEPPNE
jgi:hypothetical protein